MTKHITVALSDAEEAHLRATAKRDDVSVADVVSRLIKQQMDYEAGRRTKVQEGIDAIARGEFLSHEVVTARANSRRAELIAKHGDH